MLFHVLMTVRIPLDADPDKIRRLSEQEHERAAGLQLHCGLTWNPRSPRCAAIRDLWKQSNSDCRAAVISGIPSVHGCRGLKAGARSGTLYRHLSQVEKGTVIFRCPPVVRRERLPAQRFQFQGWRYGVQVVQVRVV
jgi:muconolactone delta-isomerase